MCIRPELRSIFIFLALLWTGLFCGVAQQPEKEEEEEKGKRVDTVVEPIVRLEDSRMILEVDELLRARIYLRSGRRARRLTTREPPSFVTFTLESGQEIKFETDKEKVIQFPLTTETGKGKRTTVTSLAPVKQGKVEMKLHFDQYEGHPGILATRAELHLLPGAKTPIKLARCSAALIELFTRKRQGGYWFFKGFDKEGNYPLQPMPASFHELNPLSTISNSTSFTLPLVDVWFPRGGLAVGYLEKSLDQLFLPLEADKAGTVRMNLVHHIGKELRPGETWSSSLMFVSVHEGDFFETLRAYGRWMENRYGAPPSSERSAYEPSWSLGRKEFFLENASLRKELSTLKRLGIGWIVIDHRYLDAARAWTREDTSEVAKMIEIKDPEGKKKDAQLVIGVPEDPSVKEKDGSGLKEFIQELHDQGFRVRMRLSLEQVIANSQTEIQLQNTDLISKSVEVPALIRDLRSVGGMEIPKNHPDWLIRGEDGRTVIGPNGNQYLCLALYEVQRHIRMLAARWYLDWGVDMVEQEIESSIPACYHPRHLHETPQDSTRALPIVRRILSATARLTHANSGNKADSTNASYVWAPCVAPKISSSRSTARMRVHLKVFRAICGEGVAIRSEATNPAQFASILGIGAVPETHFNPLQKDLVQQYEKWLRLNHRLLISHGEYVNLYDLAFHNPEIHMIRRYGLLYFSFFSRSPDGLFKGRVNFRGLTKGLWYRVIDYLNHREIAFVSAASPWLNVEFKDFLLLQLKPEQSHTNPE